MKPQWFRLVLTFSACILAFFKGPIVRGSQVGEASCNDGFSIYQQRQDAVVDAFLWAWKGYKAYAWGQDELKPISKSSQNWLGLGLTLVDSLDTMWLMGLHDEFAEAQEWVENELSFDKDVEVNFFETTIRVLGGLLSAHALSGAPVFLARAEDLGRRLMAAFASPSGLPWSDVHLGEARGFAPAGVLSSLSEVSSVQLEFRYLARLTGNATFGAAADAAMGALERARSKLEEGIDAIPPMYLDPKSGEFPAAHGGGGGGHGHGVLTLGARADSYYEYLLKQWLASGRDPGDAGLRDQYVAAVAQVARHLVVEGEDAATGRRVAFLGELAPKSAAAQRRGGGRRGPGDRRHRAKMDHLCCFLPGTLALGHRAGLGPSPAAGGGGVPPHGDHRAAAGAAAAGAGGAAGEGPRPGRGPGPGTGRGGGGEGCHLELAVGLLDTCLRMYNATATRLGPEIAWWENSALLIKPGDAHNILRPETVESLYYLYKMTGEPYYQEAGWAIFCAFEKHTRVDGTGGYAGLKDIDRPPAQGGERIDKMESFFLAETLKYFFLLFADPDEEDVLPLDEFVFNTEAHPLPISGSLADQRGPGYTAREPSQRQFRAGEPIKTHRRQRGAKMEDPKDQMCTEEYVDDLFIPERQQKDVSESQPTTIVMDVTTESPGVMPIKQEESTEVTTAQKYFQLRSLADPDFVELLETSSGTDISTKIRILEYIMLLGKNESSTRGEESSVMLRHQNHQEDRGEEKQKYEELVRHNEALQKTVESLQEELSTCALSAGDERRILRSNPKASKRRHRKIERQQQLRSSSRKKRR